MTQRILVAGMGNELASDDGFGIATVRRYLKTVPPSTVRVYEAGIAGISMVQELMDGYDALIIIDAVDRDGQPGDIYLLETDVPELEALDDEARRDMVADMHATVPSKALVLARALNALPDRIYILGCQAADYGLGMSLSQPVEAAIDVAIQRLQILITELLEEEIHVPGHTA